MPYASDAQRKFFHAAQAKGEMPAKSVHEFDEASKGKKLPEHVQKMEHGGYACMHCGGEVGEDGTSTMYDLSAEPGYREELGNSLAEHQKDEDNSLFLKAIRDRR